MMMSKRSIQQAIFELQEKLWINARQGRFDLINGHDHDEGCRGGRPWSKHACTDGQYYKSPWLS